jgi:hypothetical protein
VLTFVPNAIPVASGAEPSLVSTPFDLLRGELMGSGVPSKPLIANGSVLRRSSSSGKSAGLHCDIIGDEASSMRDGGVICVIV